MAGCSKENVLALEIYSTLQGLGCPLVDDLFLTEADSIQELLCSPSTHRTDILKWICLRISPPIQKKFSALRPAQAEDVCREIVTFGHELMLCKLDDLDLIKGLASPLRQLIFLHQLLSFMSESDNDFSIRDNWFRDAENSVEKNEKLLSVLMCKDHLLDLHQLLTPTCNPWSTSLREHLRSAAPTAAKGTAARRSQHGRQPTGCQQNSAPMSETTVKKELLEATALLQSTQEALQELQKECEFLRSEVMVPSATLSPCALRVAISDLSHLMSAFSQIYNTDFRSYCQRLPPKLSPSARVFQSVHQLLHVSNMVWSTGHYGCAAVHNLLI
uniref:HAUS augmin-like complex subunit 7 n=1 Tax=Denticeps clupeoides TaxID=299321 RepID=A0AAY4CS77_9TELE